MVGEPSARFGGGRRDRTDDLMLAKHALSQLSYAPNLDREAQTAEHAQRRGRMVGLGRLELPTSRLSSARSNQLSYKPEPFPQLPSGHHKTMTPAVRIGEELEKARPKEEKETKAAKSRIIGLTKGLLFLKQVDKRRHVCKQTAELEDPSLERR